MLLDLSYHWLVLIVILAYNFCFVVFALLWSSVRDTCNFGDGTTFLDAYYFSIETLMTIGTLLTSLGVAATQKKHSVSEVSSTPFNTCVMHALSACLGGRLLGT